jgi:protein SCO1/2
MARRTRIALGLVASLLLLGGGAGLSFLWPAAHRASAGEQMAIGGPFRLVAANGATVTDRSYRGKWLLVFFGYSRCTDACPLALANIGRALDELGGAAARFQPLFITVDPRRDTPPVLAAYMKSFDPRIVALTGSDSEIAAAAKAYRVYYAPENPAKSDAEIDHSDFIYVMSPRGRFVRVLAGNLAPKDMAAALSRVIGRAGES